MPTEEEILARLDARIANRKIRRPLELPQQMVEEQPQSPQWLLSSMQQGREPITQQAVEQPAPQSTTLQPIEETQTPETPLWLKTGQTAFNLATAPWRWLQDYAVKPIAAGATSPFWMKQWQESLTPEQLTQYGLKSYEDVSVPKGMSILDLWNPKSELRTAYEKWKTPGVDLPHAHLGETNITPSRIDVKGVLEFAVDWFIPGTLGISDLVVKSGHKTIGALLGALPTSLAEKGVQKVVGKVIGNVTGVGRQVAETLESIQYPELPTTNTIVKIITNEDFAKTAALQYPAFAKLLGGESSLLTPGSSPVKIAAVLRATMKEAGKNNSVAVTSLLGQFGDAAKLFKLTDDAVTISEGVLQGKTLRDIAARLPDYVDNLNPNQIKYLETYKKIYGGLGTFLENNGIEVKRRKFETGETYIGRKIYAKQLPDGSLELASQGGFSPLFDLTYKSDVEAIADGFRVVPPLEATQMTVYAAYNRVANKKATDYLLENIEFRTPKAPEDVLHASRLAQAKSRKAVQLKGVINRALRGEKLTAGTIDSFDNMFPEKQLGAYLQVGIEGDRETLKTLKKTADALIEETRQNTQQAVSRRIAAVEKAKQLSWGEAKVSTVPFMTGKILTGEQAGENAKLINQFFSQREYNPILREINKVNAVGRALMLSMDASPLSINLQMMAARYPKQYGKSMFGFVQALFDQDYLPKYYAKNADVISSHPWLKLTGGGATEATEAFGKGQILTTGKLGIVGKILKPFQRGYEASMDTAGIELAKALDSLTEGNPFKVNQIDAFINELRGVATTGRLVLNPTQEGLEKTILMSPQYMRATGALLTDIFRGNLRGKLARQSVASMVGAGIFLTIGISKMLGETDEQLVAHLDPTSPTFATWEIGGQNVGLGGKLRSLTHLYGQLSTDPENTRKYAFDFLRSNFAPGIGSGYDIISGRTYLGNKTNENLLTFSKEVVARNLIPAWANSVIFEGGDLKGRATRGVVEFGGGRTYPSTLYQRRNLARKNTALEVYGKEWEELNKAEQRELSITPLLKDIDEQIAVEERKLLSPEDITYRNLRDEIDSAQDVRDTRLWDIAAQAQETGDFVKFKELSQDISNDYSAVLSHVYSNREYADLVKSLNASPQTKLKYFDAIYDEWASVLYGNTLTQFGKMTDQWGEPNWDSIDRFKEYIRQTYGDEAYNYCETDRPLSGRDVPPLYLELRQAQKTLRPYWEVRSKYEKMFGTARQSTIDRFTSRERKRLRSTDQNISQAYAKFYSSKVQ